MIGGRTGNTLFYYFYQVHHIISLKDFDFNNKNILFIDHLSAVELRFNSNKRLFDLISPITLYSTFSNFYPIFIFCYSTLINLFNIKDCIINIFDYHVDSNIKELQLFEKQIIGLHFRGSDFCVTKQNYPIDHFKIIHFKYYYDCLLDIILTNHLTNIEVHIYSHPNDHDIIKFMLYYLQIKLCSFNITYKLEKELNTEYDIKLNEYNIIYLLSTYKYIILSNSSMVLWSGFLASDVSHVYICNSPPEFESSNHIIAESYILPFNNLIENLKNVHVMIEKSELYYALMCRIDLNDYIIDYVSSIWPENIEFFNYFDMIITLSASCCDSII